ncbi:MAG: hypothetical protein Q4F33_03575 [Mycoplasmatota bacterium]|nr:hypothetical protein [Mycoplasmatota bacterium]
MISEKVLDFFKSIDDADFLTMRRMLENFKRMDNRFDAISKKVFDNIDILANYNIHLIDSGSLDTFVWTADSQDECNMYVSSKASEYSVCHEVGHMLLDLFANNEVPEEFETVNNLCIERLNAKKEYLKEMFQKQSKEIFELFANEAPELEGFMDRHPEVEYDYLAEHPEEDAEDFALLVLQSFLELITNYDPKIEGYRKISGIVDSIYKGDNPFVEQYGYGDFSPLLSSHGREYFLDDEISPEKASFEEQFADYLVLRLYTKEFGEAIGEIHSLIGDEWFEMMDRHYEKVANRMSCQRGKVMQKKIEGE